MIIALSHQRRIQIAPLGSGELLFDVYDDRNKERVYTNLSKDTARQLKMALDSYLNEEEK